MVRFLTVLYVWAAFLWFGSYSAVEIAPSTSVHIVPMQQKVNQFTDNSTDALLAFGCLLLVVWGIQFVGSQCIKLLKRLLGIKGKAVEAKPEDKAKPSPAQVVQVALTQDVADTAVRRGLRKVLVQALESALRKLLTPALIEAIEAVNEKKKQAKKEAEAKPTDGKADKK